MKIKKKILIQVTAMIMVISLPLTTIVKAEEKQIRATSDSIVINEANFPDENFRNNIIEYIDPNQDGILTEQEIDTITELDNLYGLGIESLKGIEHFKALTFIDCSENRLTSLDFSKNVALERIYCGDNQLTSLDVSKNTALKMLHCSYNPLTTIDVSNNTALTEFSCDNNQLTELNINNNTALTTLVCGKNPLTTIDVSQNKRLESLDCNNSQLITLDISKNTGLKLLECQGNTLSTLNLSNNTELTRLNCGDIQVTTLDLSKNTKLSYLNCQKNQLTSLDVSKNTALKTLYCQYNQLTTIDVSNNTALDSLQCSYNQLVTLDLTNNTALKNFHDFGNSLISLHFPSNLSFNNFQIYNQRIKDIHIDLDGNFDLTTLDSKIDGSKISNLPSGVTINGTVLSGLQKGTKVQYTYDCGSGKSLPVSMMVKGIYSVKVNDGIGSKEYKEGETVTINADVPAKGKQFKEWLVVSGGITLDNPNKATASFTMPAGNVEVTAIYEDVTITSSSSDSTYQIGSGKNLIYKCSSQLEDFVGIYMDNELIDGSHYTLKSGSTIVTINGSYLDKLTVGKHTIRFEYKDGVIAETELIIKAKTAENNPEDKPENLEKPEDKPKDTITPEIKPDDKINTPSDEVKTGDETNIRVLTTLFVFTGVALLIAIRKRNSKI